MEIIKMFEENFDEMQWSLEELGNLYMLLKAYSDKKSEFSKEFSAENFKSCEKLFNDMAEQYSRQYLENTRLILKRLDFFKFE